MPKKDDKENKGEKTEIVVKPKESKFQCLWKEHRTKIIAGIIFMFIFVAVVIVFVVKKVKKRKCVSGEYGDICTMYENNLGDYSASVNASHSS